LRHYRLFFVDVLRRVQEEVAFEAANDDEAKLLADKLRARCRAELWSTHFRIARWD